MHRRLLVILLAHTASADDDVRPADHAIPVPPGDFTLPALPRDAPRKAPAEGWWKRKGACPKGSRLEHAKGPGEWTSYTCKGKSSLRPYTAWSGSDREAWWLDADDKRHGGLYRRSFAYEDVELYVHGVRVGRNVHRALSGDQEGFAHYRDGKKHGLAHDALTGRTDGGYYIDGNRHGTWFVWNTPQDLVRARLEYKHGELDGTQRWWTRDGKLLARGSFVAGEGTWSTFGPDGSRAETRCKGRDLVEATARDRAGTLVMRACGSTAPACKPLGPTGGGERQKLGEMSCDGPTIPPFALF